MPILDLKMTDRIANEYQYKEVMNSIENRLRTVTEKGGFDFLSEIEKEELKSLSSLAEQYEDHIEKIMPLIVKSI